MTLQKIWKSNPEHNVHTIVSSSREKGLNQAGLKDKNKCSASAQNISPHCHPSSFL